ncbi:peptidase, M61 (glycyl aminopeptidase) family protein [Plesiocystis pacifica SIR-1]|uniref:Peptidase, M61 (Glycyl aminopeptidase) family protein n=1 Tax=Plesiocystis pacifica SIR-1 TaxID=391625 RepID=A6G2I8_9BACT|nr:PDZ domain-containing protein [Plesiocystis pacifica]EDM79925.1 peptidase, M61 (glycyl aminopeptidase) family protein [Plesiocystis pacifica SIR-1]
MRARLELLAPCTLLALALAALAPQPGVGARASTSAPAPASSHADASPSAARTPLDYRVSMAQPQRHEFTLSLRFADLPGPSATVELPKWNPGAYHLTNAHRNVRGVVARPLESGDDATFPVRKLDENTWLVEHGGAPFQLDYRVYCGSYRGIDECFLDDSMGFFNAAYLFMYAVGHKHRPITLTVDDLPGGEDAAVATGLPDAPKLPRKLRGRKFWAEHYDALVDSPVHAGAFETLEFELHGRPVAMVMAGAMADEGVYEAAAIRGEVQRITETSAAIFGPPETALPFADYTFIYHLRPDTGGGLEHRNSTVIGVDPWDFADARGRQRFWSVTAHEFFHLWNVKRIRPAVLGPFDYDREVHTTMLWFSEGFTSYYAALILARAGLVDERGTLASLARRIRAVELRPGNALISVEQASWETWAKPDDYDKAHYSYYDKGAALGLILDLQLRASSRGQRSTDTVFQELWRRWLDTGLGLTPAELEQVFVDQAGPDPAGEEAVRAIFRDHVRGTAPIDYDRYLGLAGYRLERVVDDPGPWIDAAAIWDGEQLVLRSVKHGGPADAAGLGDGDALVAIDGHGVSDDSYPRQLKSLTIGEPHSFTVLRGGRTVEAEVVPVEGGKQRFTIVEVDEPTAAQTLLRRQWLGLPEGAPTR